MFTRARNSQLLAFINGMGCGGQVGARLDLDRDKQPRAAGDNVDLSDGAAVAARQQPKPLQTQKQGRLALGAMAAPLGGLALCRRAQLSGSSPVISSARR